MTAIAIRFLHVNVKCTVFMQNVGIVFSARVLIVNIHSSDIHWPQEATISLEAPPPVASTSNDGSGDDEAEPTGWFRYCLLAG